MNQERDWKASSIASETWMYVLSQLVPFWFEKRNGKKTRLILNAFISFHEVSLVIDIVFLYC